MARTQTLVQLSDELIARLDEQATRLHRSRSELVREAIERYLGESIEAEIDRRIVAGYRESPPEEEWSEESALELIREEPW